MDQMQQHRHADKDYDGGVPAASARAQQAAAGVGKKHEQHDDDGNVGGVPAASARAQQEAARGKKHEEPASSLNPTAVRLLREAIVSQPDGGKPAAVSGNSDILAFARAVDRVDSPLE